MIFSGPPGKRDKESHLVIHTTHSPEEPLMTHNALDVSDPQELIARLRERLLEPSAEGFQEILLALRTLNREAGPETDQETVLAYVDGHLQSWPDELRRANTEQIWPGFPHRKLHPLASLIRYLDLEDNEDAWTGIDALLDSPAIETLTHLNLRRTQMDETELRKLAGCHKLRNLRHLYLSQFRGRVNQTLQQAEWFKDLISLELSTSLPEEQICQLATHPFHQLKHLDLSHNNLASQGAKAIAQSPFISQLRSLNLNASNNWEDVSHPNFRGAMVIINRFSFPTDTDDIGDEGLKAICQAPLYQLKELGLARLNINDDGAAQIAASSSLRALERLDLRGNNISNKGLLALLRSPRLSALKELDFAHQFVGDFLSRTRPYEELSEFLAFFPEPNERREKLNLLTTKTLLEWANNNSLLSQYAQPTKAELINLLT